MLPWTDLVSMPTCIYWYEKHKRGYCMISYQYRRGEVSTPRRMLEHGFWMSCPWLGSSTDSTLCTYSPWKANRKIILGSHNNCLRSPVTSLLPEEMISDVLPGGLRYCSIAVLALLSTQVPHIVSPVTLAKPLYLHYFCNYFCPLVRISDSIY
jgi:hypothetical protein